MAVVAQADDVAPLVHQCLVHSDGHNVVYLRCRRNLSLRLAILTQWVDCTLTLGKHVPPVIVMPLLTRLRRLQALATACCGVCVTVGADLLHGSLEWL